MEKKFLKLFAAIIISISLFNPSTAFAVKSKSSKSKSNASTKLITIARAPYLGAIVADADTGKIIFEDRADEKGYPASVLKLMDILIVFDKLKEGAITLDDKIEISAEVSKIGGSQVYLKEKEIFTVDELLYALAIQSANDAAAALADYIAGSKEAFVELMNQKAKVLGMHSTIFHSVHGLPPAKGQNPDVTTARDLLILAKELLKYPDIFKYTSVLKKGFRNNTLTMRNHNRLLMRFKGCDGFKTGYFKAAGFSVVATAKRLNKRVIAVLLGCPNKTIREREASKLLTKGFMTDVK